MHECWFRCVTLMLHFNTSSNMVDWTFNKVAGVWIMVNMIYMSSSGKKLWCVQATELSNMLQVWTCSGKLLKLVCVPSAGLLERFATESRQSPHITEIHHHSFTHSLLYWFLFFLCTSISYTYCYQYLIFQPVVFVFKISVSGRHSFWYIQIYFYFYGEWIPVGKVPYIFLMIHTLYTYFL
jgi:hypothetical protein